jgi:uncharacterized membrane protein YbhN (UPF0104 family)
LSDPVRKDSADPALVRVGTIAAGVLSLRPKDPNLRRGVYAGITLLVILSVALAAWSSLSDLAEMDWRLRPAWLVFGFVAMVALVFFNAELWRRLLRELGSELPARRATPIWCVSGLARYVPTSLLMPVVRTAMAERQGVPKRVSLVSIVYELAFAFTGALIVGAYFVIELSALDGRPERYLVLALPLTAVIALQPAIFQPAADYVLGTLGRAPLPATMRSAAIARFVALYSAASVLGGLSVYGIAQAIHPIAGDEWLSVIGAFAVGTTVSLLAFLLPGGLVARETGLAVALTPVMPAGPAVAVAILARIVQIAVELLLAVLTPLAAGRRGRAETSAARAEDLAVDSPRSVRSQPG